jgi:hypothetical protein
MKTKSREKESTGTGKAPAFQNRIGGIRTTVWENQQPDGRIFFNINLVRRFRDGEEFRDSSTLNGVADGLAAIQGLRCAINFVQRREAEINSEALDD